MWNWNYKKSFLLALVWGILLAFAGFSTMETILLGVGIMLLVHWFIEEINFVRKVHGSNIAELKDEIEELKGKLEKSEKKK